MSKKRVMGSRSSAIAGFHLSLEFILKNKRQSGWMHAAIFHLLGWMALSKIQITSSAFITFLDSYAPRIFLQVRNDIAFLGGFFNHVLIFHVA